MGKIVTEFGAPVPPSSIHAVTTHFGSSWDSVLQLAFDKVAFLSKITTIYPRLRPNAPIVQLSSLVLTHIAATDRGCLIFNSLQSAQQCVEFAKAAAKEDFDGGNAAAAADGTILTFMAKDIIFAVTFPLEQRPYFGSFWTLCGVGVSTRFAEANLNHAQNLRQISPADVTDAVRPAGYQGTAHQQIRDRISSLVNRAPLTPGPPVSAEDIYLFPSGMSAFSKTNMYINAHQQGPSVLFGQAFVHTIDFLEKRKSANNKVYTLGTEQDFEDLEQYLDTSKADGITVKAIWVEFPANPLLTCVDLARLRRLSLQHNLILGVDDTIGSWANLDLFSVADIVFTSLSKSFNGYADALGGAAVLNPGSSRYAELQALFQLHYIPELYAEDALVLERNSRDFLPRSVQLNANAQTLVRYLQSCAEDPSSAICQIHYPMVSPSGTHYRQFMRPATPDFTPGFGGMFTVEFADLEATKVFYENLDLHKSVHFGAHRTLVFAYTLSQYGGGRLEWAAERGMKATQLRVGVGLEETEELVQVFRTAVEAVNEDWRARRQSSGEVSTGA